jgi:hypothetical protein
MRCELLVLVILTIAQQLVSASDKYTTRYDHIDIDGILSSERLLRNYFNCLVDKGPCTRDGLELKSKFQKYPFNYYSTEQLSANS